MRRIDLKGKVFGRLTVISYAGNRHWHCKCECGEQTVVYGASLRDGITKSCGCLTKEINRERLTKHGLYTRPWTTEYTIWVIMKQRCYNPKANSYADYGGRGIKVCDRWLNDYSAFLADMGERPRNKTLDRIDNNGDYEPANCKWSTGPEQAKNRRKRHII